MAERDSNFSEPVIGGNSETSRFFTPELQKQLGATKQNFSTSERGIFGMDISRVNKELQETRSTWTPENSTIHLIGTCKTTHKFYPKIQSALTSNQGLLINVGVVSNGHHCSYNVHFVVAKYMLTCWQLLLATTSRNRNRLMIF